MRGWLPAQLPGPPTFIYHGRGLRTIPIMKPNFKHRRGTKAVFGPTAIYDGGGKVYILYWVIGGDGMFQYQVAPPVLMARRRK